MGYHPRPEKIMIGSADRGIEFTVFPKIYLLSYPHMLKGQKIPKTLVFSINEPFTSFCCYLPLS